ncbi:MAG: glycosyltransferase family 2 protein [Lachnospiraceae bacterium]|jgi:glycosyltransferase involved in cell wall biosynthesis|nr:glycosyltransferase family 2 protein [Lachnospiraceae bacterium]
MISIIVTAYNVERYIKECIESILNQTYQDIEIIVVDDGSSDLTAEIVKRICDENSFVHYIYQVNSGVSVARNTGIIQANGDFIMFVDGDDLIESSIVATLISEIDDNTDIVANCCVCFNEEGSEYVNRFFLDDFIADSIESKEPLYLQLMKTEAEQPENQTIFTAIGVPWGKLYRTSFLKCNQLRFNSNLRRMQDNVFNMYCFRAARKIKYINSPLYRYRIDHIFGYTIGYSPEVYYHVLQEREMFFEKYPEYKTKNIIKGYFFERLDYYLSSIKNLCLSNNYKNARKGIKELSQKKIYLELVQENRYQKSRKLQIVNILVKYNFSFILYGFLNFKHRKEGE